MHLRKAATAAPVFLLALGAACSTVNSSTASKGPVGCCCSYGDCREAFTQRDCDKEADWQGWTSTWHVGKCTAQDVHPAPDYPQPKR